MSTPADVFTFLSNMQGGGYRPNRYRVSLTFPRATATASVQQKIAFTCQASEIPESTLGQATMYYMGRPVRVPGDKEWGNWNVGIYLDNDFVGRSAFESWQDQMLGFRTNLARPQMVQPLNSFADATVQAFDRAGQVVQEYRIKAMFPVHVGNISLSYSDNDQIAIQQVSFAINGWESSSTRY